MGKRLVRLRPSEIPSSALLVPGLPVHLVLRDGRTVFGHLESWDQAGVRLRDLRGHAHAAALAAVTEMVFDHKVPQRPEERG